MVIYSYVRENNNGYISLCWMQEIELYMYIYDDIEPYCECAVTQIITLLAALVLTKFEGNNNTMQKKLTKAHALRAAWYLKFLGSEDDLLIFDRMMEDKETRLGIMEFRPTTQHGRTREFWTYITNGMSQRRMPCQNKPHGEPSLRVELLAYACEQAEWVVDLLSEVAKFPFLHGSGLADSQTIPVDDPQPHLWDGYILSYPLIEHDDFNPLGFYPEPNADTVVFLQLIGLKQHELAFAIEHGGEMFLQTYLNPFKAEDGFWSLLVLDADRESLIE